MNTSSNEVIEITESAIDPQSIEAFRHATKTDHTMGIPMTWATTLRLPEFQWLDKLHVDMHELLHAEQQYHYLKALKVGDIPVVRTRLQEHRERKLRTGTLTLVVLESEIVCQEEVKIICTTTFMLRHPTGENH
jgi:hypothetical protein